MKRSHTTARKPAIPTRAIRPWLEVLEGRDVPSVALSVGDATAIEGAQATAFLGAFVPSQPSGLDGPKGMTFHNGDLFVVNGENNSVLRYGGASGNFLGEFIPPGGGGLNFPFDVAFGPDGNLYVSSTHSNEVLRYDGATGAFLGAYVATGDGGLFWPRSITFGADGNLYVASEYSHKVLRYQGPAGQAPGAFMGEFAGNADVRDPFGL
jgi:DNA-binding beta-propeller fold protein YncE